MSKTKSTKPEPIENRAAEYCRVGEEAAYYMHGLADAFEAIGGDQSQNIVHRLRDHASKLNLGTLYVEYGYRETP